VEGLYEILSLMKELDLGYVGFNFPIDFCNTCAFIGIIGDDCPVCESDNIRRVRRVTGYFSTEENIGPGKADEIKRRVAHTGRAV
jgi:anaerobic ribonucleoside-triphosphate reductase